MSNNFDTAFDNFVIERIGEDISRLREKHEKYGAALTEYSELIKKAENNKELDCSQDFARLAELTVYIRDIEHRFLYYAGIATGRKIDKAISNFSFE